MDKPTIVRTDSIPMKTQARWSLEAAVIGAVAWSLAFAFNPSIPTSVGFPKAVISFAALVLFPLLDFPRLASLPARRLAVAIRLAAAILLLLALRSAEPMSSAILACPWAALLCSAAVSESSRLLGHWPRHPSEWLRTAGTCFPVVGAAWLMLSTLRLRPLGFSHEIVLLTAMHFHYAGAILPLLLARAAERSPGRLAAASTCAILAGIPLVAAGITATQLRGPAWVEPLTGLWMATGGLLGALLFYRSTRQNGAWPILSLRIVSATALAGGMVLAAAYSLRSPLGIEALSIPFMQASHGLLMFVGFSLCGVLAEVLGERTCVSSDPAPG